MYEKVTAIALILASVTAFDEPAPVPDFPDYTEFSEVALPAEEDIGEFPLLIDYAGWALWEDADEAGRLETWIADSTWEGLETYGPDGEVFGAIIHFFEVPSESDQIVAGVYTEGDPLVYWVHIPADPTSVAGGTYTSEPGYFIDTEDFVDGENDNFDPTSEDFTEVSAEGDFEDESGGL